MCNKMYELNRHYNNNVFSHFSVSPITIIYEGVLPGCSAITITAIDSKGRQFIGSKENYYLSEGEAYMAARNELTEEINDIKEQLKELQKQLINYNKMLAIGVGV